MENFKIVLCRPSHAGNVGAAARAMKTMGQRHLALVCPCDFLGDESRARARMGAEILESAQVFGSLGAAVADCVHVLGFTSRARDLNLPTIPVESAFQNILKNEKTALVFGNETNGLSNAEIAHCTRQVFIPTAADFASLNLGAAVQIACYEVLKNQNLPPKITNFPPRANAAEREHLLKSFESAMTRSGFYNPADPGRLIARLARLFNRADLERTESQILEGFLNSLQTPTAFRKKND